MIEDVVQYHEFYSNRFKTLIEKNKKDIINNINFNELEKFIEHFNNLKIFEIFENLKNEKNLNLIYYFIEFLQLDLTELKIYNLNDFNQIKNKIMENRFDFTIPFEKTLIKNINDCILNFKKNSKIELNFIDKIEFLNSFYFKDYDSFFTVNINIFNYFTKFNLFKLNDFGLNRLNLLTFITLQYIISDKLSLKNFDLISYYLYDLSKENQ